MSQNNDGKITILLAAYNGAKYIDAQIKSILQQTYSNWQLIIRDDNSTDNTHEILLNYQSKFPDKIFLIKDALGNLGSVQNFNALLQHSKQAGYIMFCDQDDYWMPNKIEITLNEMKRLETQFGHDFPLLVYTNFSYTNEQLKPISSMKNFESTKIRNLQFAHLLIQNPIYGCTMMINKKLRDNVNNIPEGVENHDFWIALVASAFGKIEYIKEKTILYRQHDKNISTNYDNSSFTKRFKRIFINGKNFKDVEYKLKMAGAFKNIYQHQLNAAQLKTIDDFIHFASNKTFQLLIKNLKNGLRRQTVIQTILFYTSILLKRKKIMY